ncbi:CRISPR-associated helicase/endonuclease Cas3 [Arthrobacter woluwensis]|uniref:CRISPR-associated helicase/endonuclease Cas3 n=1 Tax=Arthrobacter woluwensis TaxID=156980 RepID=UPI000D12896C|nr:CRISPR-associated helicase/endonuclease Cas3 [Arthrobacter woluwensis]PSS43032.1 CRISPR-associated helicase/endonuclease Cas3 [Arthrobacter woluwensis]
MRVSAAAQAVWGKSNRDTGEWMSLWRHMQDSAAVAGKLWDEWLSRAVRSRIRASSGSAGDGEARTLLCWLAATHDIGKAHPLFSFQMPGLAEAMRPHGLKSPTVVTPESRIPHSCLSHAIIQRWLEEQQGFSRVAAASYAAVSGGHHGVPSSTQRIKAARESTEVLGSRWHEVQDELLSHCAALTGAEEQLPLWKERRLAPEAQMLLTGVVILADWIASNTELFPYGDAWPLDDRLGRAWADLDLCPPWNASTPPDDPQEFFASRFHLPPGATPNAMQRQAIAVASAMKEPGVIIIEAPMGEGKTEAALAAAEVVASRWGCGGVVFALPTQATSDAMFSRFPGWVDRLPDAVSEHSRRSVYLAHSKSGLNDDFQRFREDPFVSRRGRPSGVFGEGDDGGRHAVVAHQWLSGRKKGLLADFVVATIDQLLYAALQSKHVVLRHLALTGKVVIIDECHAYDAFMNVYLRRLLTWLASYSVPVILLSATLPAGIRNDLLNAYDEGRPVAPVEGTLQRGAARQRRSIRKPVAQRPAPDEDPGYPVIVAGTPSGRVVAAVQPQMDSVSVTLRVIPDEMPNDMPALLRELQPVLLHGGCVGIICNTVQRAQDVFQALATVFPEEELVLVHSRFVAPDRMEREARLRSMLGRDDVARAAGRTRPERLIVVGTQVLEQSLDVDFDLLITDVAPVDLLLQRIGRLHRRRTLLAPRPSHLQDPVCLIRGMNRYGEVPRFDAGTAAIYGESPLFRAVSVLGPRLSGEKALQLPDDIGGLVQAAYSDVVDVPEAWEEGFAAAEEKRRTTIEGKRSNAATFLLDSPRGLLNGLVVDLLESNTGDAEDAKHEAAGLARVRDTDESLEVVLACRTAAGVRFLPHLANWGGRLVPSEDPPENAMARALAACTVRLPSLLCKPGRIDFVIADLECQGVAAWQKSSWLRGLLVLFLDESMTADVGGTRLKYDQRLGLQVEREEARS